MKIPRELAVPHLGDYAVTLSAAERIHLLNMLPQQGDASLLRRVEALKGRLLFTDEEEKQWALKAEGGTFHWDPKALTDTVIEVGERMWDEIQKLLKGMDSDSTLSLHQLSLFDKFVENSKPAACETEG